jgi:hypothetical protein
VTDVADIPPVPDWLKGSVATLKRYITPPANKKRLRQLQRLGDDKTPAQCEEICKLLAYSTNRCREVALWLTGPSLDEIAKVQVEFLQRLSRSIGKKP